MNIVQPIRDKEMIKELKEYFKEQNERNYILFLLGLIQDYAFQIFYVYEYVMLKGGIFLFVKRKLIKLKM